MKQLSLRLMEVARHVPHGARVADIGSDHGLLPVYLVRSGVSPYCIAIDVKPDPCNVARHNIARTGLQTQISVRLGNGLTPLRPREVQVVCIAGMGGVTIASILAQGHAHLEGVDRLILQPNGGDAQLRRHLFNHGWQLIEEQALLERGRYYPVMVAERGDPSVPYRNHTLRLDLLIKVGPFLVQKPCAANRHRWQCELEHLRTIVASLTKNPTARNAEKLASVHAEIDDVMAILALVSDDDEATP